MGQAKCTTEQSTAFVVGKCAATCHFFALCKHAAVDSLLLPPHVDDVSGANEGRLVVAGVEEGGI